MKLSGHTILITGGASGIGFAFAERFMKSGNTVIVCGRRESKLKEAKEKYPELITRVCDVTDETERLALFEWVKERHPGVNVLVNNAGIQQRYHILKADVIDNWADYKKKSPSTWRRRSTWPCSLANTLPKNRGKQRSSM